MVEHFHRVVVVVIIVVFIVINASLHLGDFSGNGRKATFAFVPGTMVKFDCDAGYVLVITRVIIIIINSIIMMIIKVIMIMIKIMMIMQGW